MNMTLSGSNANIPLKSTALWRIEGDTDNPKHRVIDVSLHIPLLSLGDLPLTPCVVLAFLEFFPKHGLLVCKFLID